MDHCKTCIWYKETEAERAVGNCYVKPPVVTFIPVTAQMTASAIQRGGVPEMCLQPASARPMVFAADACAEHQPGRREQPPL